MARYVVRRLLWMVVVLFAALLVTLSNFVVDLGCRWLVPRVE
jgi:ABC-type dipeptide/oligopeptide/nickel transport system permease component